MKSVTRNTTLRWRARDVLSVVIFASLTTLPNFASEAEVSGARIALVVGNGAYRGDLAALRNPVNDARLIARTLRGVGFTVRLVEDADERVLEDAVVAFGSDLRIGGNGGVALFYYAGHGVQSSGANYLIPVDAQVETERHLKTRTVPATLVLEEMEDAPTALNIVVLDACRNNPYAASGRSVGGSRGLARMDTPPGSFFLAYSAAAGQVAEDGDGMNSVYTGALAAALAQPGLELEDVFRRAGRTVRTRTGGSQVPWREGSWDGVFHFVPPAGTGPVVPGTTSEPSMDPEQEEWRFVRDSGSPQTVRDFLERHPSGRFAGAARALLAQLSAWPFAVETEPADAHVRLADRSEAYHAGMMLPAGQYRVEVSAAGYETRTVTVQHDGSPRTQHVALRKASPRPGNRFRDCSECPELVVVPAGSYRMGSPYEWEGPVHGVTISVPFAIGRHEVTVAEFGRFVDATKYSAGSSCSLHDDKVKGRRIRTGDILAASWRNPGFGQNGRFPVVCVSWHDAQAYVAWLSSETGEEYRLPSDSEWEYAARAGTSTARYWGEGESGQCRHANGGDESKKEHYSGSQFNVASCRDGHVHTAPVGSFAANAWGLHDVLGNVWEWTEDCWNDSYAGAPSDGNAWEYGDCTERVTRGGGWNIGPLSLRAASRFRFPTGVRVNYVGFRVARTLAL